MSRIRVVAVLNVDVRGNARKHSLHWQHSPEDLSSSDLALVSDGVNTDKLYTVTWERWEKIEVRKHHLHLSLG